MKNLNIIIFILIFNPIFSQEEIGYLITDKGMKINFYENENDETKRKAYHVLEGDLNLTGEFVRYWTKDQKLEKIKQKKVQKLVYGNKKYMSLPIIKNKMNRIHELIAENDKYYLTNYYSNGLYHFYVFDKSNLTAIEERIGHSGRKDWDLNTYEKFLVPYFNDCPVLLKKVKYNIENVKYHEDKSPKVRTAQNVLFEGISNFICE